MKKLYLFKMLKQNTSSFPGWYILYKKLVTFLRASFILQLFFILTLVLFVIFINRYNTYEKNILSWDALLSIFFFSLAITTQLDAYSRYQNYKMIKDLVHKNGFRELLIKPFSGSRCQRDAVREMAYQLKIMHLVQQYFFKLGYRWYHIIPTILIRKPLLIFTKGYWITTFFVKKYKSKYFLWWKKSKLPIFV
jgi:hypothetical protein